MTGGHTHTSVEDCPTCMDLLEDAVQLYRGEFLEGFTLDSDIFEAWIVVQREKLHIQALDMLDHLTAYHLKLDQNNAARLYAQHQVELEPWRESAHRQLMRAYALSGQRGMALAQYDICRGVLKEELSVEPQSETTRLYEQIRCEELKPVIRVSAETVSKNPRNIFQLCQT